MEMIINHYIDKKITTSIIGNCEKPRLEVRSKMVVISDGEITKFACKTCDFVSMNF